METQLNERVQVRCAICSSDSDSTVLFVSGFRIARCSNCDFIFVNPRPTEQSLSTTYSHHRGDVFDSLGESFEPIEREGPILLKVVRRIQKYVQRGKLLEVGCGRGDLLAIAQSHGFSVTGCDMFCGKIPVLEGATFHDGTLKQAQFPADHFDVVVIRNVLEHLFDPNEEIKEIRRVLKPKGHLYIKVPNVDFETGLGVRLTTGFRVKHGFCPPYHLNHFSPASFKRLLKNGQFEFLRWHLEQPTPTSQWLLNAFQQTGYRFIQTVYVLTQGTIFPKVLLSCLTQKMA